MSNAVTEWIIEKISRWLLKQGPSQRHYLSDFSKICSEVKCCDVLLIEGRSQAANIIKVISQSPWSHAALYIGRLSEITDPDLQRRIKENGDFADAQLVIESELGMGTIISKIDKYKNDHIRLLRPRALLKTDQQHVISFALNTLGRKYSLRHVFDLARFIFPWSVLPRRWRSSLFQHNALQPTEDICSSMIAASFQSVHYPILPFIHRDDHDELALTSRNPKLFTPSDFDYSPYFDVIKYSMIPLETKGAYLKLHWIEGQKISENSSGK